jgi:hypothetical protein
VRIWVASFIKGGHVGIKINDTICQNFQTKKGVRQGYLLSPIPFNIVVGMLVILINRAKGEGQLSGVIPHLVDDDLSILQYADDAILFMEQNFEQTKNMKLLLSAFEQLSDLKINFHKYEIFCFGEAKIMIRNMNNYLVVKNDYSHLDIWASLCIIES